MKWKDDIRVVVGLDFGTTYSGFAYCHTAHNSLNEICTYKDWEECSGHYKTNTVLQYDKNFNVEKWGKPAFAKRSTKRTEDQDEPKSVGLFKLHLGNLQDHLKPEIPVEYKKAIIDYLREMGKLIKDTIKNHWPDVKFFKEVLLVLSVPAEYSKKEMAILRKCAIEAELTCDEHPEYLQFTSEPEAAAVYCMKKCLTEYSLLSKGTTFMVVDCGGGTVDLTTRKVVGENQLSEVTERAGDYCGSSFIDQAFLKYIGERIGDSTIKMLQDKKNKSLQYMIDHFCRKAKFQFTGENTGFYYELDVSENINVLKKYINSEIKELMEENEWLIKIDFEEIKSMFDPLIKRIIEMIEIQLDNCLDNGRDECSIMFLVGGFGQSKYLKSKIEEKFKDRVKTIVVPQDSIAAVVRGSTLYGLSLYDQLDKLRNNENISFIIKDRKLNFTYGIKVLKLFKNGDPPERKTSDGYIEKFHCIAERGTVVDIDKEIPVYNLCPINMFQSSATFYIYFTKGNEEYCDELKLLGKLKINLSDRSPDRRVSFALSFGEMELTATARNETNGQNYHVTFKTDEENEGDEED